MIYSHSNENTIVSWTILKLSRIIDWLIVCDKIPNLRMDIYVDQKSLKNIRYNELKLPQEGGWRIP